MSAKILVVDDNPTNLKLVSDVLEFEGYDILKAVDAEEAQVVLAATLPDLILMDIALPGMDGLTLTRKLKAEERTRSIRIVALTAFAMKGDDQKAFDAGCDGYITKPIDTRQLPDQVAGFLARASGQSPKGRLKILIVDDILTNLKLLRAQLEAEGHIIFEAHDGVDALTVLEGQPVDVVISDILMPRMDGYRLCHEIHKQANLSHLPIILYTATYTSPGDEQLALHMGADKYLKKPAPVEILVAALHEVLTRPPSARHTPAAEEKVVLKEYSEVLIHKLEEKMQQLEQSNRELAAREAHLRAIFENDPECVKLLAADGSLLEMNPAGLKMMEADSFQQIANQCLYPFVVEEHRNAFRELTEQVFCGKSGMLEFQIIGLKGRRFWLETHVTPLRDERDEIISLLGITRDINKRKLAEEALRIAATTFDSQEGIMITDVDGKILRVNQAFQDITGYSTAEVVGQNPRLLKSGRHDATFYQAMWAALLDTGKWMGEIWGKRKNGDIYPKLMTITAVRDNQQQLTHYVAVFRDISERKKSEQMIHRLAFYDSLTLLPNRRLLLDRLQQALAASARNNQYGALLFLDMDHFKNINDTQGHAMGDQLLIEVARRLQACVREGDSVARLGGDEFVVLLEGLSSKADEAGTQTRLVAEKIHRELGQPFILKDYECLSTASIGISLFNGRLESAEDLLIHADVAMYQAKAGGRNAIRFFDPQMQTELDASASLEKDLRQALEKQQLRLYYQIQVDNLRRPTGGEGLLRWDHPERGLVAPMQFIPLAEDTGLIMPIGLWVLQTACAQLKQWQNSPLTRDLTLAVNVSAKQFHQADFVSQVQRVLQQNGARPSLLKLELTESTVLGNVEDTISKMREIKTLGVSFSMDDFGTGYSSLQYLKRLPLNQIKIDQSFVRDITTDSNDATIVQTIIAMTKALGLDVIAEGVETEAQREFLDSRGCHAFQGYLFSKPVPLDEFEQLLKSF
jgi:diguanylate cyclase (GGDEF)-like protein/PAS domain S-box-containing protein